MSADEVERAGRPLIGFHTFADDTPRDPVVAAPADVRPMRFDAGPVLDRQGADSQDLGPLTLTRQPRTAGRAPRSGLWLLLPAIALVAGSTVAFSLKTERDAATQQRLALSASGAQIPIRVAPRSEPLVMSAISTPVPITAAAAAPSLTQAVPGIPAAAPPEVAADANRLTVLAASAPVSLLQRLPILPAPVRVEPSPFTPPVVAAPQIIPPPQLAQLTPPAPRAEPLTEERCGYARTRAEQLVCADPELADDDQRMARAYRAAIASGAPERVLAREQRDWLNARDDAARRSRRDVANLYTRRLDDLAEWLDDDPADTGR
jgi:uncharacterized protein YecT (DUF1311 family)